VLWGWLQVDEALTLGDRLPADLEWARKHPHCQRLGMPRNVLYMARRTLALQGDEGTSLAGAGIFPRDTARQRLTAPDAERVSQWELPGWCYPGTDRTPLSYHADPGRWQRRGDAAALRAVARGQEFVLDAGQYPEAVHWAARLIGESAGGSRSVGR
jgi:hypothetical protein